MNNGKICISICARTCDEVLEKLARAEPLADVIELRFDCLADDERSAIFEKLRQRPVHAELLATFRHDEINADGVDVNTPFEARIAFWKMVLESRLFKYIDLEEDLVFAATHNDVFPGELLAGHTVIGSSHNLFETPPDIGPTLEVFKPDAASEFRCDMVKIANTANTITDTIEQWYVLDWAKHYGMAAVPISMGQPGKWTRILGPAHGAFMTYAALDEGGETAPGQITARDLTDVYRVKELNRETEVYGVIAGDTSYSMSPYIQNAAFRVAAMNRVFVPLQVGDLGDFIKKMVRAETREIELNFRGFAVTNPHKQAIIPLLDEIDETARRIGAVNTVKIDDGRLIGFNTDAAGFVAPLLERYGSLKGSSIAVFGAGGAARACVYALRNSGAVVTVIARDSSKSAALAAEFDAAFAEWPSGSETLKFDIVVNTTPLGTKGDEEGAAIATPAKLQGVRLVYDLVYNPAETRLLRNAKEAGCGTLGGHDMLIAQGAEQFRIWTGQEADIAEMRRAAEERLYK